MARSHQEASKRPRGQQEASKRPARGQQEAKKPARGQQEASKRPARNRQPARGQQEAARGQQEANKKLARAKSAWGTRELRLGVKGTIYTCIPSAQSELALLGFRVYVKGATPHAVYLALRPFLLSSEVFLSQKPKGQFSSQSETFAFSSAHVQLFTLTKLTQTKSLTTHHHHTRNNHSNHDPLRHLTRITDANE